MIKRSQKNGVILIDVGTKFETSKKAVELAENNKNIFAAIGLHPIHTKEEKFDRQKYMDLATKKVVAIGEIGLDYYYRPKSKIKQNEFKEKQKQVFLQQLDLARDLNLPVIMHCRMAHEDLIKILGAQIAISYKELKGVVHCFTGSIEEMEQYLNLGFYIGINGIIFKIDLDEVIKKCPLDKILVETDCPYLTPPQEGKGKRNEPVFVKHVIQKVADIKNMSYEEVAEKTAENAKRLFNIK